MKPKKDTVLDGGGSLARQKKDASISPLFIFILLHSEDRTTQVQKHCVLD